MENIIKIDNLYFQYPHGEDEEPKLAIKGVSLEIEEGSFTAIIGQNGSGKSTLAKNLNGLLLPSKGAVYVSGMDTRDEDKIWDIRQTAGMVFQNPDNQLVSAIVEDDVAFGPENIGIDPVEIRSSASLSRALLPSGLGASSLTSRQRCSTRAGARISWR